MRNTQIQNWNTNTNTIWDILQLQRYLLPSADVRALTNGHSSGRHFPTGLVSFPPPNFTKTHMHLQCWTRTPPIVRVDYCQLYFCTAIVKLVGGPAILWCNICLRDDVFKWLNLTKQGGTSCASSAHRKFRVFYERKDPLHTLFCRETWYCRD